ncbi:MAG TPA: NADH-ubiquinone oxidoreductase-F iron-sulfur binding region domain-containing protein, partial [Dehalococcoidia bacterium]|nr:NADH-ubiquinone oxidoreductase-F iron-sulfur binding region domain-containing protein [Dehalococcoidia bacterium]
LISPAAAETPFEPAALQAAGGILGAGGVVPFTDRTCPVELTRYLTRYNREESCGKCTPCREGTPRLWDLLSQITGGTATAGTLEQLDYLNDVLTSASLCGLGQMAPNPIRSLLRHFPDEVKRHLEDRRCSAGVCTFDGP